MKSSMQSVRDELLSEPAKFLSLCALAFVVMSSYGVARPATESLFLHAYSSSSLPMVWIAVALAALGVTLVYNRLASQRSLAQVWRWVSLGTAVVGAALLVAIELGADPAVFLLYVWKDLYIVVLVELFWTAANLSYSTGGARWAYGFFLGFGSLGSIASELWVGPLAAAIGTHASIVFAVLVIVLFGGLSRLLPAETRAGPAKRPKQKTALSRGIAILRTSRYLPWLALLIAVVQIVITLVDYQYNQVLESAFPDIDARTAAAGQVYAAIDFIALALQITGGVILAWLGVPVVLFAIPLLLATGIGWFALAPAFLSAAALKVSSKAFDYSLFRAAKEILYIPLSRAEKIEGKAIVDVLTYRVAKGAASALLIALTFLALPSISVTVVALALVALWIAIVRAILRRRDERVRQKPLD